jgi:hypothetical protein
VCVSRLLFWIWKWIRNDEHLFLARWPGHLHWHRDGLVGRAALPAAVSKSLVRLDFISPTRCAVPSSLHEIEASAKRLYFYLIMSALIDPCDEPIERCSALCSEVCFELKQDVFAVSETTQPYDQVEDNPFKTTVPPGQIDHIHAII